MSSKKRSRMRTKQEWFSEYSKSHQNPINIKIHKICVPAITYSLMGLVWLIPNPSLLPTEWPQTVGLIFLNLAMLFYLNWRDKKVFYRMLGFYIIPNILLWQILYVSSPNLIWEICIPIFVLAWTGQFIGHKIEGKKPSFFTDLQFLLVGPAWVFEH